MFSKYLNKTLMLLSFSYYFDLFFCMIFILSDDSKKNMITISIECYVNSYISINIKVYMIYCLSIYKSILIMNDALRV